MKYLCKFGIGLILISCGNEVKQDTSSLELNKKKNVTALVIDSLKNLKYTEINREYILVEKDTIYKTLLTDVNANTIKITQELTSPFSESKFLEYENGMMLSILDSATNKNLKFLFDHENEFMLSTYVLNVKQK